MVALWPDFPVFIVEQNGFHVAEHYAELLSQPFLGRAVW